jgi:hypothetical protein
VDTWERKSPSVYDPAPVPKSEAGSGADSKANVSHLPETEAPSLVRENFESAERNSKPADKRDDGLNQSVSSMRPDAEVTTPPTTSAKRVSSIGWRTIVIFGIMSFTAGVGLTAVLFSKSGWDLQALHPAYESIAASLPKLVSAENPPVASSAPDDATSQIANQLQSISAELSSLRQDIRELSSLRQDIRELTSLRQDIRSLSDEIAQIRKAQEDLIRAEAESVRKSERPRPPPPDPRVRPTPRPPGR